MQETNTTGPENGLPATDARIAFATITDESFAPAAAVLLYSFVRCNPWFDSDLVVVQAGELSETTRERLNAIYPVRFIAASECLEQRMQSLEQAIPWLRRKRANFHIFELFQLSEYRHIVYVDADAYCCGDISELFFREEPLLACPDAFGLRDRLWEKLGEHAPETLPPNTAYGGQVRDSFNSGVLSINRAGISSDIYAGLLDTLTPDVFENSDFGDQMALNVYFNGEYTPISARYNYMVLVEEYIKGLENMTSLDARIVHFAGKIKPWHDYSPGMLAEKAPQYLRFIQQWRELLQAIEHGDDPRQIARQVMRQRRWSQRDLADFGHQEPPSK